MEMKGITMQGTELREKKCVGDRYERIILNELRQIDYGIIWYFAINWKQKKNIFSWRGANKAEHLYVRAEIYFNKETINKSL